VADWIIEPPRSPLLYPTVRHRHPNGTMDAVRDHMPDVVHEFRGTPIARWAYTCPCGATYVLERRR
jgi:hypothetical protein